MAKNGFRIIDSDLHLIEPADLFERYIDEPFKARAPRREASVVSGQNTWAVDGKPTPGALKLELELDQKDAGLKELPKPEQIYDFSLLEEITKSNR